ncbi:MAG TPA: ATP-dependent DNA helicase RecQ [Longimicrobium sp.]|nr:ATP-dependent DNA helicase RecQ [Longimicrobium sp.]
MPLDTLSPTSSDVPASTDLPDPAIVLHERFGLREFRPGQREVIDCLLAGGGALAVFPTGGGKSLCYQLPALLLDGVTVVVSPLIALMKDQIDYLQGRGIQAARLDSSLSREESLAVERGLRTGTLRMLYVAPERFNNERFLDQLGRARISLFAVDEAHCISQWGHNFRPDYLKLAETARAVGVERVLALTATATPAVVEDICASFGIPRECAVVTGFHRPNLFLSTVPTALARRERVLVERIRERAPGPGIVYVTLQKTAERVAQVLADAGVPARAYHAGMDSEQRTAVQEWWKGSDRAMVVATIAFGMGIDKADVRYVYHYNLPKGLESYSQEIGRAGRDGLPSTVELLGSLEDLGTLENFAYGDTPDREALRGLVQEVADADATFDVAPMSLGNRHDIRQLVLRTALTYLELGGILRQSTPFYAGYRLRPIASIREIVGRFQGERAQFVDGIFRRAKFGRTWYTLELDGLAPEERSRTVRAVEYLGEQGLAEVQASDLRLRFQKLVAVPDVEAVTEELVQRFHRSEEAEIARIGMMGELVTRDGCQTNYLLAYFGEMRSGDCGHCTWCHTHQPTIFPPLPPPHPIEARVDAAAFRALCRANPEALATPRRQARFLCGLASPALTLAKLTRHPMFGALEDRRFAEVLAWCEGGAS